MICAAGDIIKKGITLWDVVIKERSVTDYKWGQNCEVFLLGRLESTNQMTERHSPIKIALK